MPRHSFFVFISTFLVTLTLHANDNPAAAHRLSRMGALAERARAAIADLGDGGFEPCEDADCDSEAAPSTQSELAIAVDVTGRHVVVGFNDFRGFFKNPVSLSGYMWSDDGGATFHDGGQLPSPGDQSIGTVKFPQVYGDPDVKYLGGCTFIYSSIGVARFSDTQAVQTMGVHRSTDCGVTWQGPFIVSAATNPNGQVTSTGAPRDAADKEFMDVDPDTGRVMMSWSNFTSATNAGGIQMMATWSDDIATATPPTWSTGKVLGIRGQASVPRFAGGGSNDVYVAWLDFTTPYPRRNIRMAISRDNGGTWETARRMAPANFKIADQILGNDRIWEAPTLAVDNSGGPYQGTVYLAYSNNDANDGADVVIQRSTDRGATFSAPQVLNVQPGRDRSQWFPTIAVDRTTGRASVAWYSQDVATSGDLTEIQWTWSDDGGARWEQPMPFSERPFQAGWGNDGFQPNLGDYNMAVAQGGELFGVFAYTFPPPGGFHDVVVNGGRWSTPDVFFRRIAEDRHRVKAPSLHLTSVAASDSGGNGYVDPGETVRLAITLTNYVTNPLYAEKVRGVTGELSTPTPGVAVTTALAWFPNLDPGADGTNVTPFVLQIAPSFAPGSDIELVLTIRSAEHGDLVLHSTLRTGTPVATPILDENFEGAAAGWTTAHGAGPNYVPWVFSNAGFCGQTGRYAFHQNANDAPPGSRQTRWERLLSPIFTVPADARYITVDMDVCTDTEDDPLFHVQAYDGFFLRLFDPNILGVSFLVEAFAYGFTTGPLFHYPKHFPRSGDPNYFEDMSAWAGDSAGVQHVHANLPGTAGRTLQLRFEYVQDGALTCADVRPGHTCGVSVDNVVVRSVRAAP